MSPSVEKKEEDIAEVTDADVNASFLGYYLRQIVEQVEKEANNHSPNVLKILGTSGLYDDTVANELPAFSNLFSKRQSDRDICELDILTNFRKNNIFFSSVVPYVRLYKIFIDKDDKAIEVEVPFDIVAGKTPADQKSITERILKGGNGGAVGVAGFDWISEGKNEGNNSMFTVNLRIVLQDINELEKVRNTKDGKNVAILDLLYPAFSKQNEKTKFDKDPLTFDPRNNVLKADVGWNLPPAFQEYTEYFRTSLFLHLYKHNFTFHDSGKVELDISFIGNLETEISNKINHDILFGEEHKKLLQDYQILEEIEELLLSEKEELDKQGINRRSSSEQKIINKLFEENSRKLNIIKRAELFSGSQDIITKINEKKIDLKEKMKNIRVQFCLDIVKKLLEQKKLRALSLSEEEFQVLKFILSRKNITKSTIEAIKSKANANKGKTIDIKKPDSSAALEGSVDSDLSWWSTVKSFFSRQEKNYTINSETIKQLLSPKNDESPNDNKVIYFLLGDLLNIVIDKANVRNLNIFLSPFTYVDFDSIRNIDETIESNYASNKTDGKILKLESLTRKQTSMYNIPISVTVFTDWFNENIIKTEETAYSLNNFLRDVFTILIPNSIGTMNVPNAPMQTVKTIPYYFNSKEQVTVSPGNKISINDLGNLYSQRSSPYNKDVMYKNIVYISSKEDNMTDFFGDRNKDCKKNILHLDINTMTSIVRKATFSREDNQLLETANLVAANKEGDNEIIRQVYHCNVEMYGNTFFEPGNLVYIKPTYPGLGLNFDTLFKIGLGGYYRIINIENRLDNTGFKTMLKCRWEMFGSEESKKPTV